LATAVVSWTTIVALYYAIPQALALRSPQALEAEVSQRTAELARTNAALEAEIAERKRLESELREADRRKDEFIAILGHELRNPLAPIRTGLDILTLKGAEPQTVELMRQQVVHLMRLVDDLLDVSRITRGKIQLQLEPVDVAAAAQRAAETVRPMVEAQEEKFTLTLPAAPVWVQADPVRLTQIICNLLHNAAKYTDRGGRIWLTVQPAGEQVAIVVRDTGIGIRPDLLPHVFEPFMQADRALDRAQGGLGIGLTLVRSLTAMHGGEVTARSEGEGRGAEFEVRLPVLTDVPAKPQEEALPDVTHGRRILVVDDNVPSAKMLGMLLERLGDHQVLVTHDGPTALEKAPEFLPEIVLLDIGLPHMNGYEVARRLRRDERVRAATLVAVTGYGGEEDLRRSQEAGFDEHLVKPVSVEALLRILADPQSLP
jgi:signal transduction histidine kinase